MSKYILVCPECKSDDLEMWDGGSENVMQCNTCVEEGRQTESEVLPMSYFVSETWLKKIE